MVKYGRKSGTEHLKEKQKSKKKKKMIRGSLKEYQILRTRTSSKICNEITTSFQIYKKVSSTTPAFFFIYQMGEICPKCSFFKSILTFFYNCKLTD